MEGLRHQGRPRRQWIHNIEEWTGCEYIQLKEMSQDRAQWCPCSDFMDMLRRLISCRIIIIINGEGRYQSGHLLSPTLIEEGRLVSE